MIRNIFLLALLCVFISSNTYSQSPRFRTLNTGTGVLGAVQDMPTNAIADDFGPRDFGADNFHGGVDFNAAQNDQDGDLWYPMISPQAGVIADFDRMTQGQDRYKYGLVNVTDAEGNGSHTLLFGHVFDWMHQFYNEFNGKIILQRCEPPDNRKWALHLSFTDAAGNAVQHTYGQINGATLDINGATAGGTFTTTNVVNTTDIFMPIG